MFRKYLEGLDFSEEAFAMDSIRAVEPGGHQLGAEHTIKNFRTAICRAELFDYGSAEQSVIDGSKDGQCRAIEKYKRFLKDYEEPPLYLVLEEAALDFTARRKEEIKG